MKTYQWTRQQYTAFHKKMAMKMMTITAQKNADYTGNTNDPFANFRQNEEFNGMTKNNNAVELGFLTRMGDKWSRIKSIVTTGRTMVKSETLQDTIVDFANYLILVAGYLEERAQAKAATRASTTTTTAATTKKVFRTADAGRITGVISTPKQKTIPDAPTTTAKSKSETKRLNTMKPTLQKPLVGPGSIAESTT